MHLSDDHHWLPFGIVASRSGAVELVGQTVAQSGDLSVKRGERYVGLFGPKGMLAYGTLRKNGNIDHIHQVYSYEGRDLSTGAIEVMFDKVADYLRKQAKGTAEPLDLSKSESAS